MSDTHLGVVIVTFNAADIIADCLESLLAAADADGVQLHVAVVDNASTDGTPQVVADWQSGAVPYAVPQDMPMPITAVPKPVAGHRLSHLSPGFNAGFAGGVNHGLRHLMQDAALDRFWVLNPDSVVPQGTVGAFARHDPGPFSLMGGRVMYYDRPDVVQIDGGLIQRRTGVTGNANLGASATATTPPAATETDFVTGASMVASRAFIEAAGYMEESYFLYYEEVDWALQRGELPLAICPEARVYHKAGTAIGSPTVWAIASPFSQYFKHRARHMFVRRHLPTAHLGAWAYSLAKAVQYALKGHRAEAGALLRGALDITPPPAVLARLTPEAAEVALSPKARAAYARHHKHAANMTRQTG